MRRNMDLARAILLELEQRSFTAGWHEIEIGGYSPEEISYHLRLLYEAGFIDATDSLTTMGSPHPEWRAKTITWEGHEFLESSRDKTRWEKAKGVITEKGGAMTLDALKLVLSELIRKAVVSL
jgi:DNA-binding transcriptional ArsR family regulator